MLKCIIVDDEPDAVDVLLHHCQKTPFLKVLKTFHNPIEALQFIHKRKVDLILLDINMPEFSGIQMAQMIGKKSQVIFTTAYSEYAVKSYDLEAIDYLLKPISYQRFLKAIGKLKSPQMIIEEPPSSNTCITIKSGNEYLRVDLEHIAFIKSEGNYMTFNMKDSSKLISRMTIAEAQAKVGSEVFIQVHRSYIVNTDHISKLSNDVVFLDDFKIPLSPSFKKSVREKVLKA